MRVPSTRSPDRVTPSVRNAVTRWSWLLGIVLAACTTQVPASASAEPEPTGVAPTPPTGTSVVAPPSDAPGLDEVLPAELGGVQLHTFAVGQESLDRLAGALSVDPGAVEAAFASEHGERFLQMTALRVPDATGQQLLDAWAAAAYPPETPDVTVTQQDIGGHAVTVVDSPTGAARFGTYYTYALGDTLIVVQAFDPHDAAEALAAVAR